MGAAHRPRINVSAANQICARPRSLPGNRLWSSRIGPSSSLVLTPAVQHDALRLNGRRYGRRHGPRRSFSADFASEKPLMRLPVDGAAKRCVPQVIRPAAPLGGCRNVRVGCSERLSTVSVEIASRGRLPKAIVLISAFRTADAAICPESSGSGRQKPSLSILDPYR